MRSKLGATASAIVLLSIVGGIVAGMTIGEAATRAIIHFGVGTGFVLLAVAMFDFGLARWVTWLGAAAAAAFGGIFLLQGVADQVGSGPLYDLAFPVLGQTPERLLPELVLLWFIALLLTGTQGRSRILGWIVDIRSLGRNDVARTVLREELRIGRVIRILRLLIRIQVIEHPEKLIEAVHRRQKLVAIAEMVFPELSCGIAKRLRWLGPAPECPDRRRACQLRVVRYEMDFDQ